MEARPDPSIDERVRSMAGAEPAEWRRVRGGGYTPAERWIVRFADGSSAFAKAAVDGLTADWLRAEHRIYDALEGPFLPAMFGWQDGDVPILLLEDLSSGHWPPPWREDQPGRVLSTLEEVHSATPPAGLPPLEAWRPRLTCWIHGIIPCPRSLLQFVAGPGPAGPARGRGEGRSGRRLPAPPRRPQRQHLFRARANAAGGLESRLRRQRQSRCRGLDP